MINKIKNLLNRLKLLIETEDERILRVDEKIRLICELNKLDTDRVLSIRLRQKYSKRLEKRLYEDCDFPFTKILKDSYGVSSFELILMIDFGVITVREFENCILKYSESGV